MDDATDRPKEMEIMSLLEQINRAIEEAEGFIQDDGKISGKKDITEIRERMLRVRALSLEIDHLLSV